MEIQFQHAKMKKTLHTQCTIKLITESWECERIDYDLCYLTRCQAWEFPEPEVTELDMLMSKILGKKGTLFMEMGSWGFKAMFPYDMCIWSACALAFFQL